LFQSLRSKLKPNPWAEPVESAIESSILESSGENYLMQAYQDSSNRNQSTMVGIAKQTKDQGYVLIPDVFQGALLTQLQSEFAHFIANTDKSPYQVDRHDGAVCIRVKPRDSMDAGLYPATSAFYGSRLLLEIATLFYGVDDSHIQFNNVIFVHETPATKEPLSGKLHWDRSQTLKFWIYLDDIPPEAGPMQILPGSGNKNRLEREDKRKDGDKLTGGLDNLADTLTPDAIQLTGTAGSILIHDTDASHGATPVSTGFTRKIMRGHTRLKA
jgi:Phytanoyl-CoA dioxygenase (PhyH)